MSYELSNKVIRVALSLAFGCLLSAGAHCEKTDSARLRGGFGFECRGVAGNALGMYLAGSLETRPVALTVAVEADACSSQLSATSAFDLRAGMVEIGTGSFLTVPFDARLRAQFERYALAKASLCSVIPLISFDVDAFYVSMGLNFRALSLDDGNPFEPYYTAYERQFTFEIGGRIKPTPPLTLGLSMRNFDDYRAGSYASIGFRLDCDLALYPWLASAELGILPAGASALSATGSGVTVRFFLGRQL